jgi:prevent-host-death family protein
MQLVNIHDAKTRLSKLLEQVRSGEDVVIAKAGVPIARLVPYTPPKCKIAPPGAMEDEIWIADDFDEPLDNAFECLNEESPT